MGNSCIDGLAYSVVLQPGAQVYLQSIASQVSSPQFVIDSFIKPLASINNYTEEFLQELVVRCVPGNFLLFDSNSI